MKISKILTYLVLVVGVLGGILWYTMSGSISSLMDKYGIADAKDLVKENGSETFLESIGTVDPIYNLTLFIFVTIIIATIVTVFMTLAKNPSGLKKTILGIGIFIVILAIGYTIAEGTETPLKDGEVLSEMGSRWVGTGLYMFYILAFSAVFLMLTSGVKKIIGK